MSITESIGRFFQRIECYFGRHILWYEWNHEDKLIGSSNCEPLLGHHDSMDVREYCLDCSYEKKWRLQTVKCPGWQAEGKERHLTTEEQDVMLRAHRKSVKIVKEQKEE